MIKNESLGDRLTNFKNKEEQQYSEEPNIVGISPLISIVNSLISLAVIFIKSFVFGYGLMTIINADWRFFGYFCVGMAFNFFLEFVLDVIALFISKE